MGGTKQESIPPIPNVFVIDEQKLQTTESQEKQELYVLQWLTQVERECKSIDPNALKPFQKTLEKTLLKLISLQTAKPRRPIRFLIGRCFALLYTKGDTHSLFDTVTVLQGIINGNKSIDKETRIAAISTAGAIMGAAGGQVLSLFADTATSLIKIIKNNNHTLLLRIEAMNAFTLLLKGAGKAATEIIIKELMKQLKLSLVDKALALRIAAAQCLQAVIQYTTQSFTAHDVDILLQVVFKAFDGASFSVRRTVASLGATLLACTQTKATSDPNKPNIKYITTGNESMNIVDGQEGGVLTSNSLLSVQDMLSILSACFNRPTTSREIKIGLIETYATVFVLLGTRYTETHYGAIVKHMFTELLSDQGKPLSASNGAFARAQVLFVLHNIVGKRLLSEQGQANAIRVLISDWLKSWPALLPNQTTPCKHILLCALQLVSSLVTELEGATSSVQDILADPLFVLLTHPSFAVQMASVWCLRCLCEACPSNLMQLLPKALTGVEKYLGALSNPGDANKTEKRSIALAYAAAALISVFRSHTIYTSFELTGRAISIAIHQLKHPSKDPRAICVQVEVAWTLVGSVMCLGPDLVKLHLPQLLLLWKSVLPKPTGKETGAQRSEAEWSFLFHTRERAIGAIYSFLIHNHQSLVTLDIAKRLCALLNNTLVFLTSAPNAFSSTTQSPCAPYETKVMDQYYCLKRRIFQCFVTLQPLLARNEASLASMLRSSLLTLSELDKITPSSGAATLVTATIPGQFISLWGMADGSGYGVTSKMRGYQVLVANHDGEQDDDSNRAKEWITKDRFQRVEELLERPMIGSLELDPIYVYSTADKEQQPSMWASLPVAPSTALVDASIDLFATLFPSQPASVQESTFEHMAKVIKDNRSDRNSPRRAAVLVNVVVALLGALRNIMASQYKPNEQPSVLTSGPAIQLVHEILMEAVAHPDPYLRNGASEAIGRLTAVVGGGFVASQMQQLVDLVVNNRDPDVRAGCALAIGYIYSHVGGMAAAVHLKTLVGILLSLSSDPHPVVHAWALEAMAMMVSAAGLLFSPYVHSTLGMVAKLYLSETHEPGSGSVAVTNAGASVGFSAYQEFGRIIYELIGTLGPELQSSTKIRELCLNMVEELKLEPDERTNVEAIRCIQHFLMFAPQHMQVDELVPYLQQQISSLHLPLKKAAVTCLYQLVQRDANLVFKAAHTGLDTELFKMLDTDPGLSDVKNVIRCWLKETAESEPSVWVNITKRIVTGGGQGTLAEPSTPVQASIRKSPTKGVDEDEDEDDFGDDDADGFVDDDIIDIPTSVADASGLTTKLNVNVDIPPRWRTQLFALECLHETIEIIAASEKSEHFDLALARRRRQQAGVGDYLVFRVPDLIRLSFTAATAHVNELRLAGISLLQTIIEKFAATQDADMEGMMLLEQYAAQIGAAVTPAFGAESTPEILSAGVRVCAIYVGSGIVNDIYQLGRVLKLLTSALDRCCNESKLTALGDVKDLSPHASAMIKLSVLNAWAELQVSSIRQEYLRQVLQPNLESLSPMWLKALQDYARIRLESDIMALSNSTDGIQATTGGGIESMYSAATKRIVLPFYRQSWLKIMEAVASLIDAKAPSMITALEQHPEAKPVDDGPCNMFYILFGLCIESLSRLSNSSRDTLTLTVIMCLKSLRTFVQPVLVGQQFLPKPIFLDLMNVFDRLIQTEGYVVQAIIIETVQRMIQAYGSKGLCSDLDSDSEPEAVDRVLEPDVFPTTAMLYYLLRLVMSVLMRLVPGLSIKTRATWSGRPAGPRTNDTILLNAALDTLVVLVNITPTHYKNDLLALCFHVFLAMLSEPALLASAPRVLVCLKAVLSSFEAQSSGQDLETLTLVIAAAIQALLRPEHDDSDDDDDAKRSQEIQKNKILSAVLIMTSCPTACLRCSENRERIVNMIQSGLTSDNVEVVTLYHQCLRTFVVLPTKKAESMAAVLLGQQVTHELVPQLVELIMACKTADQPEELDILTEHIKTLVMLPKNVSDEQASVVLSMVLSTLTELVDVTEEDTSPNGIHEAAMKHIISLATELPAVFRDAVAQLPLTERATLETAVRRALLADQQKQQQQSSNTNGSSSSGQARTGGSTGPTREPTIALKMDFSHFS